MQTEVKGRKKIQKRQESIKFPRLVRLFSILGQLSPHSQWTVQALAEEYGVDRRTIVRDIEALQSAKLGVFCHDDRVWISRIGYRKIKSWLVGGV